MPVTRACRCLAAGMRAKEHIYADCSTFCSGCHLPAWSAPYAGPRSGEATRGMLLLRAPIGALDRCVIVQQDAKVVGMGIVTRSLRDGASGKAACRDSMFTSEPPSDSGMGAS